MVKPIDQTSSLINSQIPAINHPHDVGNHENQAPVDSYVSSTKDASNKEAANNSLSTTIRVPIQSDSGWIRINNINDLVPHVLNAILGGGTDRTNILQALLGTSNPEMIRIRNLLNSNPRIRITVEINSNGYITECRINNHSQRLTRSQQSDIARRLSVLRYNLEALSQGTLTFTYDSSIDSSTISFTEANNPIERTPPF